MAIDCFVILVICVMSFKGYRRGLLFSLFSLMCITLSFIVSVFAFPFIGMVINRIFGQIGVVGSISNYIMNSKDSLSGVFKRMLGLINISYIPTDVEMVIRIVLFTLLWFFMKMLIAKLLVMFRNTSQNISSNIRYDKMLGLLIGFCKSIFVCAYLCIIMALVLSNNDIASANSYLTNNSQLLPLFCSVFKNYIII